ncbi:DinB family protein [Sorangium sp. So ce118]|nr:DinB family protein [Sorangium sp.]
MASLLDYLGIYAQYNQWANEQIIAAITKLDDAEYYQPVLPKSRSIHELLNHVLVMDKLWISELRGIDPGITSGMQMLHPERGAYIADRRETDAELVKLVGSFTMDDLDAILDCSEAGDDLPEYPMMLEAAHVFRHQVHHRGQITILLQHTAVAPPKLDGLFVPAALRPALAVA